MNDAFVSIVADRDDPTGEMLLVRARRKEDLERFFRRAQTFIYPPAISHSPSADYPYRVFASSLAVVDAMTRSLRFVTYDNFKDSVQEDDRHDAYFEVWSTMNAWGKGAFRKRPAIGAASDFRNRQKRRKI